MPKIPSRPSTRAPSRPMTALSRLSATATKLSSSNRPSPVVGGSRGSMSRLSASARPTTTGSAVGEGGEYVVAVLQSKSSGVEVGLAAINADTGRMTLTQIADTSSYLKTLQYLSLHAPRTILVPDSQLGGGLGGPYARKERSKMVEMVEDEFQLRCQPLPRMQWNAETGLDHIKRLCIENETKASVLMAASDRYYALCAASALLTWTIAREGSNFSDKSVKIQYETMKGHMFIDSESARNLELVKNNLTMKSTNTLFSTLNTCYTPMGERLLRSSILQPSNQKHIIENRFDAVEELINAPDKLRNIRKALKTLETIDFDRLITSFSTDLKSEANPSQTEYRISLLLQLRKVVTAVPELTNILTGCTATLLGSITSRMLSDPSIREIASIIDERINDETSLGQARTAKRLQAKTSKLYAIKSHFNALLDVARSTYQENVTDIMDLNEQNKNEFGITTTLEWSESGYRFVCYPEDLEDVSLPQAFINVERNKRTIKFTSHELLKRNARMVQTQEEVFLMSDQIVADMLHQVVDHIGCLYTCSEAIALIDLIASFAYISSNQSCVRPTLGNSIIIKNGRHPILETTLPAGDCIPNDVYASDASAHFQLVQGPNMSGKSTYLRQIGVLTVQAMIGCFVPAEYATIKCHDALLTRLSNDDNMEKSLSTFAAEMATSAMILGIATHRSLVLIDELGRGTATVEGVGLSQAIAEQLIKVKAFTFFATHFQELAQTLCTYRGVQTLHLRVQSNSHMADTNAFTSTFHYKVVEGSFKKDHYGLESAKLAALPEQVMKKATEVATKLSDLEEKGRNASLANALAMRRKVIIELRGKLQQVRDTTKDEEAPGIVQYLQKLKQDLTQTLQNVLELEKELHTSGTDAADTATAVVE